MKKVSNPAQQVIDLFPSFDELINNDKYGVQHLLHPFTKKAFSKSNQWEGIAMAVDNMCEQMYGKRFYTSYAFTNSEGSASVLPAYGDEISVNKKEFQALLKIMIIFNMGMVSPTDKQYEAYLDFKSSDSRIYKILD